MLLVPGCAIALLPSPRCQTAGEMSSAPSPSLPTGGAPVAPPTGGGGSFRGLIAQKEKELQQLHNASIRKKVTHGK